MSGHTEPPEALSDAARIELHEWCRVTFGHALTTADLDDLSAECFDWYRANGKRRKDWVATVRNWIRKELRMRRERTQSRLAVGSAVRIDRTVELDKWERYKIRNGRMHEDDPRRSLQGELGLKPKDPRARAIVERLMKGPKT